MLDHGSTSGATMFAWRDADWTVSGIDPHRPSVESGRAFGLDIELGVGEALPFEDQSFDLILSLGSTEHAYDLSRTMSEAWRVLKPGAHSMIRWRSNRIFGSLLEYYNHNHYRFFSPNTWRLCLERYGFSIVATTARKLEGWDSYGYILAKREAAVDQDAVGQLLAAGIKDVADTELAEIARCAKTITTAAERSLPLPTPPGSSRRLHWSKSCARARRAFAGASWAAIPRPPLNARAWRPCGLRASSMPAAFAKVTMMEYNPRLLVTEPGDFSPRAMARLSTRFRVDLGPLSRAALLEELSAYEVLFVRLSHRFDREILSRGRSLAAIVSPATGLNHIDLKAASEMGVTVLSLRDERAFLETIHATAELTWGLILALARRIPAASHDTAKGGWDRDRFKGVELSGRTLGVVGYGRLGARVAHYARAFGMQVIACDPTAALPDWISGRDLDALCAEANVISIHVTSKPENVGLIGERQFAAMKPSALFVNTSRGDIVDERALLRALAVDRLGGAALDVLAAEYDPDAAGLAEQLRRFARETDRLIITPHIGGATYDSMARTEELMVERLFAAMDRGEIRFRAHVGPTS